MTAVLHMLLHKYLLGMGPHICSLGMLRSLFLELNTAGRANMRGVQEWGSWEREHTSVCQTRSIAICGVLSRANYQEVSLQNIEGVLKIPQRT